MASGGEEVATITYELSTPCNGFLLLIGGGYLLTRNFQLHVMDSTFKIEGREAKLTTALSTPCNGF